MVTAFGVVGDLSLDIVVAQSGPQRFGSDVPAKIRIGPGGQGANVAVRLARQGADARLVAAMADDTPGRLLREALQAERVSLEALEVARSTVVLALLDDMGERTMFSDRQTLDAAPIADALAGVGWIHCSGYPLLDDRTGDQLAELLGARAEGVRLSVAGGSVPGEPARVSRLRLRLAAARPDLLLLSAEEAESLLGTRPASGLTAARSLAGLAPLILVTSGVDGSAAAAGDVELELPAHELPGPMLDSTGSGDAYLAAALVTLADATAWPPDAALLEAAMQRGSRLGAEVARVVGAQGRVASEPARGDRVLA
jgi:sugar/nucleoside kinase (ribokinase family)